MPQAHGTRIIKKRITPPEVGGIAAQFRSARDRVNALTDQLTRAVDDLSVTWEGNSKNKFYGEYDPTPGQLRNLASTLDRLASEIEHITVEIDVTERY